MAVAVIGMGARFPGDASTLERFWNLLVMARSAQSDVPKSRFNANAFYHPHTGRTSSISSLKGHFLAEDPLVFDAPFFSMKPKEAKETDPQQRNLLEVSYQALENAGLSIETIRGTKTCCYVGAFGGDYRDLLIRDHDNLGQYAVSGLWCALAANRISWFFDLKGPSMSLDSACSSSLVALHLACQSILRGESKMGIAAGSNLILGPDTTMFLSAGGMLSPDSKSQAFDHKANGYARGEGFGALILKNLDDAIRDGDSIRAVIRGTASNHDGRTSAVGHPSSEGQAALIRTAYEAARLSPLDTGYFEAHGTGTRVGDSLETSAIAQVFGSGRTSNLFVGSVKTSIGHTEGTAGIAGVIKAILIVERGVIPPNLWFEKLSPRINLPPTVKIATEITPWLNPGPRIASINSFGIGGANAHCIVQDAGSYLQGRHDLETIANVGSMNGANGSAKIDSSMPFLLIISAKDKQGTGRIAAQLDTYLNSKQQNDKSTAVLLHDLAFTLSEKRSVLPWKAYVFASDIKTARKSLVEIKAPTRSSRVPRLGFVFTGQGAQWYAMGRELFRYPQFRGSIISCDSTLKSLGCSWSLLEELNRSQTESRLDTAELSQAVCTALQVALVDLFLAWGIQPAAVVGHSSGEIAAAYAAGILSRQAAMTIAYYRGISASSIELNANVSGGMAAVRAGGDKIAPMLCDLKRGVAVVACYNSPSNCTVSGDKAALDELQSILEGFGIGFTRLNVRVAYHSQHMNSVAATYLTYMTSFLSDQVSSGHSNTVPFFSSVRGGLLDSSVLNPQYWAENITSPVNFTAALYALLHHPRDNLSVENGAFIDGIVEIGPHSALRSYCLEICHSRDHPVAILYVCSLRRGHSAFDTMFTAAGDLWCLGSPVNLSMINRTASNAKTLVDLPPYPFNHSISYSAETTASREFRSKGYPHTGLLGAPVLGSMTPQWRKFLRIRDDPWMTDHKVQSKILYPGAGYLAMVIEAMSQLSDTQAEIAGFELHDVLFDTPLQIPDDDEGIETVTQISYIQGNATNPWSSFVVASRGGKDGFSFQTHCKGKIRLHYKPVVGSEMAQEIDFERQKYLNVNNDAEEHCLHPVPDFYEKAAKVGMGFGPIFQNLSNIHRGSDQSYATIIIPDTKSIMPGGFEHPHIIHPATLDALAQTALSTLSNNGEGLAVAVVAAGIQTLYIDAQIARTPGHVFKASATRDTQTNHSASFTITVLDSQANTPSLIAKGVEIAYIGKSEPISQSPHNGICWHTTWEADVDLLSSAQVREVLASRVPQEPLKDEWHHALELITFSHIKKSLEWLSGLGKNLIPKSGTLKHYHEWMLDTAVRRRDLLTSPFMENVEHFTEVHKKNGPGSVLLEMVDRIGRNQNGIFKGIIQPLEVMLEGKFLHEFYDALGASYNIAISEYMRLVAHKMVGQVTVLEIGAGTGGTTARILDRLRNTDGSSMIRQYYFTDVSAGFLGNAAARFSQDASMMEFKTLDIEQNPLDQGFYPDSFDIVVASGVLHATKSIANTLRNCQSLLKPSGRLVLAEPTENNLFVSFIMGTLPGWWLGEDDGRKGGPSLSTPKWHDALCNTGFSGVDLEFRSPSDATSMLVSTKLGGQPTTEPRATLDTVPPPLGNTPLCIIVNNPPSADSPVHILKELISVEEMSVVTWESLTTSNMANMYFLSLLELDRPFIRDIQEGDFKKLKELLYKSSAVCWMTCGASIESPNPELSLMTGLARTLINESDVNIMLVDLEKNNGAFEQTSLNCASRLVLSHLAGHMKEREIAIRKEVPQIPRLLRLADFEDMIRRQEGHSSVQTIPYGQIEEPIKLVIQQTGLLDGMCFEIDQGALLPILDDWVEIDVKAVGLNPEDLLVTLGKLKDSSILGFECSGQVTRIGSKVVGLQPGHRVWAWAENCLGTSVRFPWWTAINIPASMGYEDAAGLMAIYVTVYYSFFQAGRLRKGESVLIHSAADAIGQAAIILAQYIGADIYCTVESDEKRSLLMELYGIPTDHIFRTQGDGFAKGVMRMTKEKGVDVVLNSLSGESLRLSWQCLGEFGRFLEIGIADIQANNGLEMRPFGRNRSFIGVNLREFMRWPCASARAIMDGLRNLLDKGVIKPVKPINVFDIGDAELAFRHMQKGKSMGKTILRMSSDSRIQYKLPSPCMPIDPTATYLLVGGMGGVGRVLANWLVSVGAKNIAFLSRSAATNLDNQRHLKNLENYGGINAKAWDCDATNKDRLEEVLANIQSTMPQMKGTIVASMVLRDSHFERMTLEDWTVAVQSKVHVSQYLHELLPKNLEFFVMLSSGGGIMGYRGQANYHAGNVYQDALAHHRRSLGQAALTIDMGPVMGVGWMSGESVDISVQNLQLAGVVPSSPAHLGALIAASSGPNAPPHPANITLALPASYSGDEPYYWMNTPRFSALRVPDKGTCSATIQNGQANAHPPLKDEIAATADARAAGRIITMRLVEWITRLMAMPQEDIDTQRPLTAYGVDSLVAVELRNWLRKEAGVELGVLDIIRDIPLEQLCLELANMAKRGDGKINKT